MVLAEFEYHIKPYSKSGKVQVLEDAKGNMIGLIEDYVIVRSVESYRTPYYVITYLPKMLTTQALWLDFAFNKMEDELNA